MRNWLPTSALCSVALVGCVPDGTTTDIGRYEQLRQELPSELVAHFPNQTPREDQHPHFYYTPGPLQANESMQLSVTLSPSAIRNLAAECEAAAMGHYVGYSSGYDGDLPRRAYPWDKTTNASLTSDDHIFVLFQSDNVEPAEAGIVVNKKTSRVLYYCTPGKHWHGA